MKVGKALERKKVWTSFVGVMLPPDLWSKIQSFREPNTPEHLKAVPHITLLDPFIEPTFYKEATEKFRRWLKELKPFEIELSTFAYFPSKSNSTTLYLTPSPKDEISKLQAILQNVYPYCDEVSRRPAGFQPHLTIGRRSMQTVERDILTLQADWEKLRPVKFVIKEICLISREGKGPYKVRETIPLGPDDAVTPPYFASHPFEEETNHKVKNKR